MGLEEIDYRLPVVCYEINNGKFIERSRFVHELKAGMNYCLPLHQIATITEKDINYIREKLRQGNFKWRRGEYNKTLLELNQNLIKFIIRERKPKKKGTKKKPQKEENFLETDKTKFNEDISSCSEIIKRLSKSYPEIFGALTLISPLSIAHETKVKYKILNFNGKKDVYFYLKDVGKVEDYIFEFLRTRKGIIIEREPTREDLENILS